MNCSALHQSLPAKAWRENAAVSPDLIDRCVCVCVSVCTLAPVSSGIPRQIPTLGYLVKPKPPHSEFGHLQFPPKRSAGTGCRQEPVLTGFDPVGPTGSVDYRSEKDPTRFLTPFTPLTSLGTTAPRRLVSFTVPTSSCSEPAARGGESGAACGRGG